MLKKMLGQTNIFGDFLLYLSKNVNQLLNERVNCTILRPPLNQLLSFWNQERYNLSTRSRV
jgi:hypothetical protein